MDAQKVMKWIIDEGFAKNEFQASAIMNGLKLYTVADEDEAKGRVRLYRKWRARTDKKNDIPSKQAFDLSIAGIDPADVKVRQMDFEQQEEDLRNTEGQVSGW